MSITIYAAKCEPYMANLRLKYKETEYFIYYQLFPFEGSVCVWHGPPEKINYPWRPLVRPSRGTELLVYEQGGWLRVDFMDSRLPVYLGILEEK